MANPGSKDWLEPPLWWKKWRPLRWLAAFVVVGALYSWLKPESDTEAPQRAAPVVKASPVPAPQAAPEAGATPVVVAAAVSEHPPAPATPAPTAMPAPVARPTAVPTATVDDAVVEGTPLVPPAAAESDLATFTRREPDPVRLLGSYRSYVGVEEVVLGLERAGYAPAVESRHAKVAQGVPPRNLDMIAVHQYRHWGVQGRLELQFFNDRLYQTEFEPEDAELYRDAQRRELPQLKRERAGRSELIEGDLRVASSLDLSISEVGQKLRTRPFLLWQDRRLVGQRDEWDRRFGVAAVR